MQVNWQSLAGSQFLPKKFPSLGEQVLAVGINGDSRLEVFVATGGAVWHLWQTAPNGPWAPSTSWTSRGQPPGISLTLPAVERNADGRLELFAAGTDGAIWHTWQTAPNNGWIAPGAWTSRGKPQGISLTRPAVVSNADKRLEVFAAGTDGAIWHAWQTAPNNGWIAPGAWASRGRPGPASLDSPAVFGNIDGRLELCAHGSDGAIWHVWQTKANNGWVAPGAWTSRGKPQGVNLSSPTIKPNSNARLEIFAAGDDNAVYHMAQTQASNGWAPPGAWSSLGRPTNANTLLSAPVVINNQGGKLEVFALYDDHTIDHIQQLQASGAWPAPGAWALPLDGAKPMTQPAVGYNANGLLDCFVGVAGGELWHVKQKAIAQW